MFFISKLIPRLGQVIRIRTSLDSLSPELMDLIFFCEFEYLDCVARM